MWSVDETRRLAMCVFFGIGHLMSLFVLVEKATEERTNGRVHRKMVIDSDRKYGKNAYIMYLNEMQSSKAFTSKCNWAFAHSVAFSLDLFLVHNNLHQKKYLNIKRQQQTSDLIK